MAHLIDAGTLLSTKSELALFTLPCTQIAVDKNVEYEVRLSNPVTQSGPYSFFLPGDMQMIDFKYSYIYMRLSIVKSNGADNVQAADASAEAIAARKAVGPINLIGKTFFCNVKLYLGSNLVSDAAQLYHYRCFLETELNYGDEAKSTHLATSIYAPDTPLDKLDSPADNTGQQARAKLFDKSAVIETTSPLHIDIFNSGKHLLSNIDVKLELERNSDAFLLKTAEANPSYKLHIDHISWLVRKVTVTPGLALALESKLIRNPAKYPIRRVVMGSLFIDAGRFSTPQYDIITGQIPRRLFLILVNEVAFNGSYTLSPFNLQHFNMTEISVTAGGQNYPQNALKVNFENKKYLQAYLQTMSALDLMNRNKGNSLTREKFVDGTTVLGFDLSPDNSTSGHWNVLREGCVTVNLTFGKSIPPPGCELIWLAEFDNCITIDRNRHVTFDFQAS